MSADERTELLLQALVEGTLSEEQAQALLTEWAREPGQLQEAARYYGMHWILKGQAPADDQCRNVMQALAEEDRCLESAVMMKVQTLLPQARASGVPPAVVSWRRYLIPLAAAASVAIAAGVWSFSQKQDGSLELRVAEVRGECSVFRLRPFDSAEGHGRQVSVQDSEGRGVPAEKGMELRQGDRVVVGEGGLAGLKYDREETKIELRDATEAAFGSKNGAKWVRLDGGKLICSAAPQVKPFEIKTRHTVSRVVGTRFSLDADAAKTVLAVMEGKVELIQGTEMLEVDAGGMATATDKGMEMAPQATRLTASMRSGDVWAWGQYQYGLPGSGTTNNSPKDSSNVSLNPVLVPGMDGVTAVAAGFLYTVALKADGTVVAWGRDWARWARNDIGQLGDGTTTDRIMAAPVSGLSGIVAIAAGEVSTVALKNDGRVFAWGRNDNGQLGDGTTNNRAIPVQVQGLSYVSDVTAIAAGPYHALAIKSDRTVWAWGRNDNGQLGDGTSGNNRLMPVQVKMADGTPLRGVMAIAAGNSHTVALKSDGTVWAWGGGIREVPGSLTPVPVKLANGGPLSGITAIAAGMHHTVALKADHTVWGWGSNNSGALSIGERSSNERFPVQAKLPPDGSPLSGITAIFAGGQHTLARKEDGTLWAWGDNYLGQLGDGTSGGMRSTPVQVMKQDGTPLTSVIAIAAGQNHTVAIVGE